VGGAFVAAQKGGHRCVYSEAKKMTPSGGEIRRLEGSWTSGEPLT